MSNWIAVGGAVAALFASIGALWKVTYEKPKAKADAEAQRLANAAYPVTSLQALCATLQQRMGHLEAELTTVRENYRKTQDALDAALDRIGILAQENREWAKYYARDAEYHREQAEQMRAAGMQVPEPPTPPHPRTEFTRRTDFPTRSQFEASLPPSEREGP